MFAGAPRHWPAGLIEERRRHRKLLDGGSIGVGLQDFHVLKELYDQRSILGERQLVGSCFRYVRAQTLNGRDSLVVRFAEGLFCRLSGWIGTWPAMLGFALGEST